MQLFVRKKRETEAEEVARICREVLHPETIPIKVPMNPNLFLSLKASTIIAALILFAFFHVQIVHYAVMTYYAILLALKVLWFIVKWFWIIVLIDLVRALYHKLTRRRRR